MLILFEHTIVAGEFAIAAHLIKGFKRQRFDVQQIATHLAEPDKEVLLQLIVDEQHSKLFVVKLWMGVFIDEF